MHQLVRILVCTDYPEDVLGEARYALMDGMVEPNGYYDYGFVVGDDDRARFTERVEEEYGGYFFRADTEQGRRIIDEAWEQTHTQLRLELDEIRDALGPDGLNEEDILNDVDLVRHKMHHLGSYGGGPAYFLYDEWGAPIREPRQYDRIATSLDEVAADGGTPLWVAFADVHF